MIATNKRLYYDALERSDACEKVGLINLDPMKDLIEGYPARQLADAFEAGHEATAREELRKFH